MRVDLATLDVLRRRVAIRQTGGYDLATCLEKVEDRARLRATGAVYSGDRDLDRRVARLARKMRKALAA